MASQWHDLFISYAHADDEVPLGADRGWVTTLVHELNKVLRRKLGGSGASIWMDHQLAANDSVDEALLAKIRTSQILLLVMSPGYLKSWWCQRELDNFLSSSPAHRDRQNVFVVEIEPIDRPTWPVELRSLKGIRFWEQAFDRFEKKVPRLMGYPTPKPNEDNPYWRNVNELAHTISESLSRNMQSDMSSESEIRSVLVAEATDDLLDDRESVVCFLKQRGIKVLPETRYPRDSEVAYLQGLKHDLAQAALYVQLLGPFEGQRPPAGQLSFVALQAREAQQAHATRGLPITGWRRKDLLLEQARSGSLRSLLSAPHVLACRIEELKTEITNTLSQSSGIGAGDRPPAKHPGSELCVYVSAAEVDTAVAADVGQRLERFGVSAMIAGEPDPGQSAEQVRLARTGNLEACDGVVIVYGRTPPAWVHSQFAFARRVLAQQRRGVWGALLDAPPEDKPPAPVRSPSLVLLDCRRGLDPAKLAHFVDGLRQAGAGGV